ncbi:PepSY-associated TM helix domain-containing protein [Tenacibaculum sp. IB213877]|uniref:PepSY-associated TM helix domain-containing protein n=1 Tax=Tenacibaculum sp. IB213877 TaxID=3097351 RepID=UPI002A599DC8|nr:PepSY-associated TM helix domain-containing protein [Tenacibaculum sp. IB213877]MDY0780900.1 PepSY-associated TM helix domain-containing protein [Tenacibaculum sp. IB213877]
MAKKNKKKNSFKKWIGKIHLWLGLISGIIVFIVAITGTIFVFHDEIRDATQSWRKITPENTSFVLPSKLIDLAKQRFPDTNANMVVYQNNSRPAHIYVEIDNVPHNIYFNPYSGEITHLQNLNTDFFLIIEKIHMHLLLPPEIGKQVVGISTLIFIVMLITGIILWWPKKWKNSSMNFKIKWKAKWRRVNYDWHRTIGLYNFILALIIAVTGLSFSYEWIHDSFYLIGNLGQEYPKDTPTTMIKSLKSETSINAIDLAFMKTRETLPQSGMYFVWNQGEELPIITGAYPNSLEFHHQSNFYFHPQTGEILDNHFYEDKSPGLKLQEMNYGLHTGQYFGFIGKLIAFLISLFVASLPITGFLIWRGRKVKKNKY